MIRILLFFAFAITVLSTTVVNAALVKYTYTGNLFDNISFEPQGPTNVSFEFVLDDSLVDNNGQFLLQVLNPTEDNTPFKAGSFGSLVQASGSIQDPNQTKYLSVAFNTNLNGNISGAWNIQGSYSSTVPNAGGHFDFYSSFWTQYDASLIQGFDRDYSIFRNGGHDFSNSNNPGIWTRSLIPVPIPSSILLLGSVLSILYLRRFFNNQMSGFLSSLA